MATIKKFISILCDAYIEGIGHLSNGAGYNHLQGMSNNAWEDHLRGNKPIHKLTNNDVRLFERALGIKENSISKADFIRYVETLPTITHHFGKNFKEYEVPQIAQDLEENKAQILKHFNIKEHEAKGHFDLEKEHKNNYYEPLAREFLKYGSLPFGERLTRIVAGIKDTRLINEIDDFVLHNKRAWEAFVSEMGTPRLPKADSKYLQIKHEEKEAKERLEREKAQKERERQASLTEHERNDEKAQAITKELKKEVKALKYKTNIGVHNMGASLTEDYLEDEFSQTEHKIQEVLYLTKNTKTISQLKEFEINIRSFRDSIKNKAKSYRK